MYELQYEYMDFRVWSYRENINVFLEEVDAELEKEWDVGGEG